MNFTQIFSVVGLIHVAAYAQPINLKGHVYKGSNLPLPNAVVTILGTGSKDTTDAQGAYSFDLDFSAVRPGNSASQAPNISLKNSELRFQLENAATLTVEAFDVHGSLLGRFEKRNISAGQYRFDIARLVRGGRLTLIRASVGNQAKVFRSLPLFDNPRSTLHSLEPVAFHEGVNRENGLAKRSAVVDSVKFEAGGFAPKTSGLPSYEAVVDVSLERMTTDLAEFSFFLTSQEGLFKLAKTFSGSEKGFGGDLRYGLTGIGSGLKGADKICEALAESSLPGSKAKGWRAFLSATADGNGKQVNAIDRIGEGPWYDRLGRLVANDKAGLLSTRPAGSSEIINDLPNEFGVPNHRPDPTLPEVDNHLTMTGSNNLGKLYGANSTCGDWTSVQARPGPRVGMSWPQAAGMPLKNWISEWEQAGCEAGFDLDPSTGAGTKNDFSVGKGGGYGGYYCFALIP
jgi:hypothetical protein